jgi:hypothetical protein
MPLSAPRPWPTWAKWGANIAILALIQLRRVMLKRLATEGFNSTEM